MSYKILALDGGANWSLLQCMALEALYPGVRGHQILERFNLVAANSGGSLVLARLLKNQTPKEILATFDHPNSPTSLFVKLPLLARLPSLIGLGPIFSTAKKRERIAEALGAIGHLSMRNLATLFSNSTKAPKIVVVGFDYDQLRAAFFRSFDTKAGTLASNLSLTDAINASSTAPVAFFDKPAVAGERLYWDGAIGGYNNPVMAAMVEAFTDGATASDIVVLSLGTAATRRVPLDHDVRHGPRGFFVSRDRACLLTDIRKLAGSILAEPPDAAGYAAYVSLGNAVVPSAARPATLVRLNPSLQPVLSGDGNSWTAPHGVSCDELQALMNLPAGLLADKTVAMIKALGGKWIDGFIPNEPIRYGHNLECLIGDATFPAGRKHWQAFDAEQKHS
jgi:hypothetical protein